MKNSYKWGLVIGLVFVSSLCNLVFAAGQTRPVYSQVEIDLTHISLDELAGLGLVMEGEELGTSAYRLPVSEYDLKILKQNYIRHKVIVPDIGKWVVNRNQELAKKSSSKKAERPARAPEHFKLGSLGGYQTYDEMVEDLDSMRLLYPHLISEKWSIGESIEGRTIWTVRISNSPDENQSNKVNISYDALIHAREGNALAGIMYLMWHWLETYETDEKTQTILNSLNIYVTPCFNPDGWEYNRSIDPNGGGMWRKNRRENADGTYGIDLNRNFGTFWGQSGSSGNGNSDTYRGTEAFSEPEAAAFRDLALEKMFTHTINAHSYANKLTNPWGIGGWPDNEDEYRELGARMTATNGWDFGPTPNSLGYLVAGAEKDWNHEEVGALSFVTELGHSDLGGFWAPPDQITYLADFVLDANLELALDALEKNPPVHITHEPRMLEKGFHADIHTTKSSLNIRYQLEDASSTYHLSLYDVQGKEIKKLLLTPSESSVSIDQGNFSKGVYLLQIKGCSEQTCRSVYNHKITLGL